MFLNVYNTIHNILSLRFGLPVLGQVLKHMTDRNVLARYMIRHVLGLIFFNIVFQEKIKVFLCAIKLSSCFSEQRASFGSVLRLDYRNSVPSLGCSNKNKIFSA